MNVWNCGKCGKTRQVTKDDGKTFHYICDCVISNENNMTFSNLEGITVWKLDLSPKYYDLIRVIKQ